MQATSPLHSPAIQAVISLLEGACKSGNKTHIQHAERVARALMDELLTHIRTACDEGKTDRVYGMSSEARDVANLVTLLHPGANAWKQTVWSYVEFAEDTQGIFRISYRIDGKGKGSIIWRKPKRTEIETLDLDMDAMGLDGALHVEEDEYTHHIEYEEDYAQEPHEEHWDQTHWGLHC